MAKDVKIGTTDRTVLVFIPDPASTDGSGKTGLAHTAITVSNTRVETDNDVVVTDYTSSLNALTNLTDAHNDWGWKEVSSTLAPGLYRLDLADAVFASGAWYSVTYVMVTSSEAAASPIEFNLIAYDPLDTVRMGLTALPNAAAEAAGGLFTRGTGAGQINQAANGQIDSNSVAISAATANKIADHIHRRSLANIKASSDGDTYDGQTLLGAISKAVNKISISGGVLTIYEADGTTVLFTQTVTSSPSAEPITALETT